MVQNTSSWSDKSLPQYSEGTIKTSLTTGNNDGTLDLASATIGQKIGRVMVSIPGKMGNATIQFFDSTPATTAITGALYIDAMPADGFLLNCKVDTGTLGYRIAELTEAGPTAYINVSYSY